MATVLVIGASKGIGLETVKRALNKGHAVRAFARTAHRLPIDDPRLSKIMADATDAVAIAAALQGADAVIQCLGAGIGFQPVTVFSKATRVLVDAMAVSPLKRLIAVTGLGAGDSRGIGSFVYTNVLFPLVLKRIYDDKDVQEQIIKKSSLDWTIVRPGILTNGPETGAYKVLVERKDWRAGSISRADVADFLISQVTDRTLLRKTPLLVG